MTSTVMHKDYTPMNSNALKRLAGVAATAALLASAPNVAISANTLAWDKTFPQSALVTQQKVSFYNRLGIQLIADLYLPKNLDRSKKAAAIIVGHPYGGVIVIWSCMY